MRNNICKSCKHWQGNKDSWGDCYWVIGDLYPQLHRCYKQITESIFEYWVVPFDPHDIKYWFYNELFHKRYNYYMKNVPLPQGFRLDVQLEEDLQLDQLGAERIGNTTLYYIQTHKNSVCNYYKENHEKH